MRKRKIFFDTEFVEDGVTIDLISIGMVDDRGEILYLVSNEFNLEKAKGHEFVAEHVLPQLPPQSTWVSRAVIRRKIEEFVGDPVGVEFWADYGSYDWVVFCRLFGAMVDLPEGYPMFAHDFQQYIGRWKKPEVEVEGYDGKEHDALYDALELKALFERYEEENIDLQELFL